MASSLDIKLWHRYVSIEAIRFIVDALHGMSAVGTAQAADGWWVRARRQLQGNNLDGSLPQFGPGSWVSLSALNLTGNDFDGSPLPPEWGRSTMVYIKYMDLANCSLVRTCECAAAHLCGLVACTGL